jgi:site-specific DNA-methyltransferase (adenine-specific)
VGTVAANVLEWGTGGLNIDGSRVASDDGFEKAWDKPVSTNISAKGGKFISEGAQHTVDLSSNRPVGGRFPANVIHDGSDEVVGLFRILVGVAFVETMVEQTLEAIRKSHLDAWVCRLRQRCSLSLRQDQQA